MYSSKIFIAGMRTPVVHLDSPLNLNGCRRRVGAVLLVQARYGGMSNSELRASWILVAPSGRHSLL